MKLTWRQQRRVHKWKRRAFWLTALLMLCMAAMTQAQNSSAPLSKDDVLKLLQSGIPPKRVATLAKDHKINFAIDESTATELREAGATETLIATLRQIAPAPATTVLLIRSRPGGAQVYIDDEPVGTTSSEGRLKLSTLPSGQHRVRVSAEGYEDFDRDLDITRGEVTEVDAALQPKNSVSENNGQAIPESSQPFQPTPTPVPQPIEKGSQPVVYFFRPNNFNGNLIAPTLYCDGISLGKLPNARYFSMPFSPGKHIFTSTNKKSRVELDLANGGNYYIMVYMVMGLPARGALSLVPNDSAAPQLTGLSPCGTNTDIDGRVVSGCGH